MKATLHRIVAAGVLAALPALAAAQAWPAKSINLVMGYGAGSGADLEARQFAPFLSNALGVPVIVDGRPGAGGIIGAEYAARQAPDGYTLFLSTAGITTFPHLDEDLIAIQQHTIDVIDAAGELPKPVEAADAFDLRFDEVVTAAVAESGAAHTRS